MNRKNKQLELKVVYAKQQQVIEIHMLEHAMEHQVIEIHMLELQTWAPVALFAFIQERQNQGHH